MNRKLLAAVALVVLGASLGWLYLSRRPHVVPWPTESFDQLAQLAGDATAKLRGNRGTVVVVQWDATRMGIPRYDGPIAQFRERAGTHGVKVVTVATIKLKRGVNTPGPQFAEIVRQHASVDAIVLFGPAYGLKIQDVAALPAPHPRIVSVASFDYQLKPLFAGQLIDWAIIERGWAPKLQAGSAPYVVVTAQDAADLPDCPPPGCE